ncbi:MAG: hypothetical protein M3N98_05775 [Actinomycetota bacterium]|nr:hypothetical protein [Actinomycetota bacterium]
MLIGLLGTLLVLVINTAMSARTAAPARQLAEQTYLDQALPGIQDSSQQGREIDLVRTQALQLSGTTITSRVAAVLAESERSLASVERLNPPASAKTAHALLVAALDMRTVGVKALGDAIGTALSGQPITTGVQALADVGLDFEAADRAYSLFEQAMPAAGAPVPHSRWVVDTTVYSPASLSVFVASLRNAGSLAPVHDVSVAVVTTDPAPVNLLGPVEILPIAKQLNVQIVVANTGNQSEKNLTVSATVAPSTIGPTQMVRNFVDLSPGLTKTVSMGGLKIPAGQPVTLTVRIDSAPGETNVADNTKVIAIQMQ